MKDHGGRELFKTRTIPKKSGGIPEGIHEEISKGILGGVTLVNPQRKCCGYT